LQIVNNKLFDGLRCVMLSCQHIYTYSSKYLYILIKVFSWLCMVFL